MSHNRMKMQYKEMESNGDLTLHTLYVDHNLSADTVSFYKENGDLLFSVSDTVNGNLLDAINCLHHNSPATDSRIKNVSIHEFNNALDGKS